MTRKHNPNAPVRRAAFPAARVAPLTIRTGRTRTDETPLRIKLFGLAADDTGKDYIRDHVGFKLGKFGLHIQGIELRLRDESGPHGAPVVAVSLSIMLEDGGLVVVERAATEPQAAFDRAVDVAERAIRRALQRRRSHRRDASALIETTDTGVHP